MQTQNSRIEEMLQDADRYDLRADLIAEREAIRDEMIMEPRSEYPAPRRQEGGEVGW